MQTETITREELARQQRVAQQLDEHWRKRLEAIGNDIALRKWCIEHGSQHLPPADVLRFLTEPIMAILHDAPPSPPEGR